RLPCNRMIMRDSHGLELEFLTPLATAAEPRAHQLVNDHAANSKDTIKGLAARKYPKAKEFSNALDKVVLFVPAESVLSAALEGDRDLIIYAAEQGILLATPSSLLALLYAVAMSWTQQAQTENVHKISEEAKE